MAPTVINPQYNYNYSKLHNIQVKKTEPPITYESIFICTTSEPKEQKNEQISFKGNPKTITGVAKLVAALALTSLGAVLYSSIQNLKTIDKVYKKF